MLRWGTKVRTVSAPNLGSNGRTWHVLEANIIKHGLCGFTWGAACKKIMQASLRGKRYGTCLMSPPFTHWSSDSSRRWRQTLSVLLSYCCCHCAGPLLRERTYTSMYADGVLHGA